MSYPLIILGAGASFDFINQSNHHPIGFRDIKLEQHQPPLTNGLFDTTRFNEFIGKYPEIHSLASDAKTRVNNNFSLEDYLTEIQEVRAKNNVERYSQLVALRYYLANLFKKISSEYYKTVNNYQALITKIKDGGGKACFVTFNYDLLLERNLQHIFYSENIDSYITASLKVIKIHGACNWVYKPEVVQSEDPNIDGDRYFIERPNLIIQNCQKREMHFLVKKTKDENWKYIEHTNSSQRIAYLPAIAIPIAGKDNFVCPQSHIEELKNSISKIDRILIIGWNANDDFLLTLLGNNIRDTRTSLVVVSGSRSSAEEIKNKLTSKISVRVTVSQQEGFTNFMNSGECDTFLEKKGPIIL